jgi:Sec-independent protein translocase protein TatA
MNISISEILVVVLIAMLFFKPSEIREHAKSFFKVKKTLESEVDNLVKHINDDDKIKKIEFFDVEQCKNQENPSKPQS